MSPQQRLEELRRLIGVSIQSVVAAAAVYAAMEQAGDDVRTVPVHLRRMLQSVAAKTVLPEVVIELTGRLRQRVQYLPLSDQRSVVEGAKVAYLPSVDAEQPVEVDPRKITPHQVEQIFAEDYIRSPEEQRVWMLQQRQGPTREGARQAAGREAKRSSRNLDVQIDKAAGIAIINGAQLSRAKLRKILEDMDA